MEMWGGRGVRAHGFPPPRAGEVDGAQRQTEGGSGGQSSGAAQAERCVPPSVRFADTSPASGGGKGRRNNRRQAAPGPTLPLNPTAARSARRTIPRIVLGGLTRKRSGGSRLTGVSRGRRSRSIDPVGRLKRANGPAGPPGHRMRHPGLDPGWP